VQRELLRNTVMAVEYSGSRGDKLYSIAALNERGFGCIYLGDCVNGDPTLRRSRLNNQFTGINLRGNGGDSWYNGLNTRFQTSNLLNSGLTLTANYTWAHAMDTLSSTFSELNQNNNLGFLDPFNPRLDKGDADFDVRHRIVVSGTWDVPAFKNQQGAFGRVLGGWSMSPIFTAQTGYPFTIYDCSAPTTSLCARYVPSGGPLPLIGNKDPSTPTGPNLFDYLTVPAPVQFFNPTTGQNAVPTCGGPGGIGPGYFGCSWPAGMTARNAFRQPGIWNLNFSAAKNIKLTERFAMEFRGELYNLFNHSNLYVQTGGPFNNGGAADASSACDTNGVCSAFTVPSKRGSTPTTLGSLGERRFVQFALRLNF
jgi:hypothetical protein